MPNFRRNLAVKVETPGGDNPLLLFFVSPKGTPPFYRGVPLSGVALKGKGGTPPYAYSIIAGTLPTGLSLNGITGEITGTPTVVGHFTFVARVQDFAANVFTKSFSIDIKSALVVVRGTPTDGENLLPYSYQMVVRDLTGTTVTSGYTLASGNLPDGLTINSAGLISGNPTFAAVGFSYATINVNTGSDSLDIPIVIHIYDPLLGFSIDYRLTLYATVPIQPGGLGPTSGPTGGRKPYSYRWDNLADYPWLSFDYNAGAFYGTPPYENIGVEQVITGLLTDSLGATLPVEFRFTPVYAMASITNLITPNRQANVTFVSSDGSIEFEQDTSGNLDFRAIGGGGGSGISTINGVDPDTNGNLPIAGIGIDSNGDLFVEGGSGVTYTDTGILITGGAIGGVAIVPNIVSNEVRGMSLGQYDYDSGNWQLWVYPAPINGTVFTLDVWVLGFTGASSAVPTNANSIVASAPPSITGTAGAIVTATGSQATWTASPLQKGNMVTAMPTVNSAAVQWYCLFIPARRTF